jgi:MFS transporter, DHA1 family, tetracycline resistance protein
MPDKNLTLIYIIVFLDTAAIGMALPVMPALIRDVTNSSLAEATQISGWLFAAFAVSQIVCGPTIGALSDALGRRPLLLFALAGLLADYCAMAFSSSLWLLFVGRIFAGAAGACGLVALAYVADITDKSARTASFGIMGSAFGFGFIAGPALGGTLSIFGHRTPFVVAAAFTFINIIFSYLFLSESLAIDRRRKFSTRSMNPLRPLAVFTARPDLITLATVFACYIFSQSVAPAIWTFWSTEKFGLSSAMVGVTLLVYGFVVAITQAVGTPKVIQLGLLSGGLACAGLAASNDLTIIFLILLAQAPEYLVLPVLNGIMSKAVSADTQGALQGGLASLNSLAMLIGTIAFTPAYGYFSRPDAPLQSIDAPFWIASLCFLGTLLLFRQRARYIVQSP